MDLESIKEAIQEFVDERDWEKYHTPKNIAMALSVEASELAEVFQWLDSQESLDKATRDAAEEEIADVFYYLVRMCQLLDIDLEQAFHEKMKKNRIKHDVNKVKGKPIRK